MNIAETTSPSRTAAIYNGDTASSGGSPTRAAPPPVRAEQTGAQTVAAQAAFGTGRTDSFVASTITDQNAMYDVADIRRRGGGHILPRYQITHRLTLEGDKRVEKLVDVALATERKSLRIYREQQ